MKDRLATLAVLLALFGFGWLVHDVQEQADTIKSTQHTLQRTQRVFNVSAKESTEARVKTVAQRCDLTQLISNVLDQQDSSEAGAFHKSYRKCEEQLTEVKAINARTP